MASANSVICAGCHKFFTRQGYASHIRQTKQRACVAIREHEEGLSGLDFLYPSFQDDTNELASPRPFEGDYFGTYTAADFDEEEAYASNLGGDTPDSISDDEADEGEHDDEDFEEPEQNGWEPPSVPPLDLHSTSREDHNMDDNDPAPPHTRDERQHVEESLRTKTFVVPFPGGRAGASVSATKEPSGYTKYRSSVDGQSNNQWAPFASKLDWEVALISSLLLLASESRRNAPIRLEQLSRCALPPVAHTDPQRRSTTAPERVRTRDRNCALRASRSAPLGLRNTRSTRVRARLPTFGFGHRLYCLMPASCSTSCPSMRSSPPSLRAIAGSFDVPHVPRPEILIHPSRFRRGLGRICERSTTTLSPPCVFSRFRSAQWPRPPFGRGSHQRLAFAHVAYLAWPRGHFGLRGSKFYLSHVRSRLFDISTIFLDNSRPTHVCSKFYFNVSLVSTNISTYLSLLVRIFGTWTLRYLNCLYVTVFRSKSIPQSSPLISRSKSRLPRLLERTSEPRSSRTSILRSPSYLILCLRDFSGLRRQVFGTSLA